MRIAILVAALLMVAVTACNKTTGDPATTAETKPAMSAPAGEPAGVSSINADDLLPGDGKTPEEEAKPMNTVPADWLPDVPVYENGEVIFGESHGEASGVSMSLMIETTDSVTTASDYYSKVFTDSGCERLDTRIGPTYANSTWLVADSLVDIAVRQVPDEMGKMQIEQNPDGEPPFEGTLIHIQTLPANNYSHLTGAVSWYGLDAVPPGFPVKTMPRYPGGEIIHASFGGEDTVLQQVCDDETIAPSVKFYKDKFTGQGREMVVSDEDAGMFSATFTDETSVVHVNIVQNSTGDTRVSINIFQRDK